MPTEQRGQRATGRLIAVLVMVLGATALAFVVVSVWISVSLASPPSSYQVRLATVLAIFQIVGPAALVSGAVTSAAWLRLGRSPYTGRGRVPLYVVWLGPTIGVVPVLFLLGVGLGWFGVAPLLALIAVLFAWNYTFLRSPLATVRARRELAMFRGR
ncbi:hypothetical protein ARHIZOSPH14_25200 [Agromyces rhizosphaerae]|uniref:Uncharacterized protein n=1 Tax=Agromyces rhizosphaerae TaxID=88374 RepID=A0A9W6FSL6_9MICO|nr:hypothetical protein ARHIZOSPH14_25200 [Agromyces rhizosphaerae]